MAKKVKEVTGVYAPFWTKESIENFGALAVRSFNAQATATVMEYKCETHLPFYCLPRMPFRVIDSVYYDIRNCKEGVTPPFVSYMDARKEPKVKKLLTMLWEKKRYEQFMIGLMQHVQNSSISYTEMVAKIKEAWYATMGARVDTQIYLPAYPSCTGALNIIKHAKVGSYFGLGQLHSKVIRTGPWAHPKYLYGRYFISHLVDLAASGQPVFNHGGTQYDTNFVPVPLMSLMFKVEHLNLIRGYMLNNKEVPAEMMELWVDEKLDNVDSQHPIRLQYMRHIKKPLIESGVTVKVVPNLDALMYERMTVPKFKSIKMQKEWQTGTIEKLMDAERMSNGIITKKEDLDKSLNAIFGATQPKKVTLDGMVIDGVEASVDRFRREFVQGLNI